jgi:hypothetical protein
MDANPSNVPAILGAVLHAPVYAVVHGRGQVVRDLPLERGSGFLR